MADKQRSGASHGEGLAQDEQAYRRQVSLVAWPNLVLRNVLRSKTPFAWFVHKAILHCRDGSFVPSTTALFPIPLPRDDVWSAVPKHLSKACRLRKAYRMMMHLVLLALNYLHFAAPLNVVHLLGRCPSSLHLQVYERLLALIKAGGPVDEISILRSGRKAFQLDARLTELFEAVQSLGLDGLVHYTGGQGKVPVPCVNEKDELRPYRELNAGRLKLSGSGQWDPGPFLSDLFVMPYLEPRINQFNIRPPRDVLPDLSKVKKDEVLKLCRVWDARGLLKVFPSEAGPKHRWGYVKVFNNFKNELVDRQIGDRRGMNFCEGKISGPSRSLPTGVTLLQLAPMRFSEMLVGAVTDRRDFYHQFKISDEKACSNALFPVLSGAELKEMAAFQEMCARNAALSKKKDRTEIGDKLGFTATGNIDLGGFIACFGALYQGDHLGVEFATDAHSRLMQSHGLLSDEGRLQSSGIIFEDEVCSGLIIDDFFVMSREKLVKNDLVLDSKAVAQLKIAKDAYKSEGLLGSDDKDVIGATVYKVCGAEIDSSWSSVTRGVVSAGAPVQKRLALGVVSSAAASLRFTSDAFHACLVGSWVSTLLMRRQAMAVLNDLFQVIPPDELDTGNPQLRRFPRSAADELCVLSCLAPILCSNLAVPFAEKLYATDASTQKGGIVAASVGPSLAALLWRSADRVGANVPMLSSSKAVLATHDSLFEHELDSDGELEGENYDAGTYEDVRRPLGQRFQFIEVCGGAGVVTSELLALGAVCGPVLDLSVSKHYNLAHGRVIQWIIFMMEDDRLDSFLVSPPCTSFSPAAYPSVRSYAVPRGHDQNNPKVVIGNILAFAALTLLLAALRLKKFGLGEQPRRSKMRWLLEWRRLLQLGAKEVWLASCAYGSIHQKEFTFVGVNMVVSPLHRPCPKNHKHVKIEGKFTKPSATYCKGLAVALAALFNDHLKARAAAKERLDIKVSGLEDLLSNESCTGLDWEVIDSWAWKGNSHINVLETAATLRLFRRAARDGGDVRLTYLADSHVSRSVIAKGRSGSASLKQMLKTSAAICLAFGLYPAGRFAPTRLNPADHPTRDTEVLGKVDGIFAKVTSSKALWILSSISKLKRWASNWSRLAILLSPSIITLWTSDQSLRRHPLTLISNQEWLMDFDSSLGFPGEGPLSLTCLLLCFLSLTCAVWGARGPSHGDELRRQQRSGIVLEDGRRVTATTAFHRETLLGRFKTWLSDQGDSFDRVVMRSPPDLDLLNQKLVEYGRFLFSDGKPYYHFAETINSVTSCRPLVRRSLQQAWDLAFLWNSHEPGEHHIAMPFQILMALISICWTWGWKREAAIFALAFGGLLRIGEIISATRSDLILPSDVDQSIDYALLRVGEPKTRFRAARHQAAKLEQVDLIEVVRIGFGSLRPDQKLWPMSGSTLRLRLTKLLDRLKLPTKDSRDIKALSLASFRPGGATWLMAATESAETVRRRGRWASFRIMEIYLQEVMAVTYMTDISADARKLVMQAFRIFSEIFLIVQKFDRAAIPESTWFFLIMSPAT